ncbi:DNA translocase FtsK [Motiliproteus coralliicola]|uniref:DNA translocase FtsK n=1 Tax=Motiliproteus coralliicola TaxID=2283196 RepID=A0A369WRL4_9GAMM|nr:DNA translocase FtsK [Motiliproteus coralliicola]RDE24740.1 DNA translocase FtsK [Motiliproteus coralliicola]
MTDRQAFSEFISRITKEGGLILFLVLCSFLLLALFSFDARDPGWSHLGYTGSVQNAAGSSGAWLADFFYSMFGYMAPVLPLMLVYRAWRFLRRPQERWLTALPYMLLRAVGAVLLIGSGSALAAIHFDNRWLNLPFEAGGLVGLELAEAALLSLGVLGGTLILLGVLLLGVTLFTDLSWLRLTEQLGSYLLGGWQRLLGLASAGTGTLQHAVDRAREESEQPAEQAPAFEGGRKNVKTGTHHGVEVDDLPPFSIDPVDAGRNEPDEQAVMAALEAGVQRPADKRSTASSTVAAPAQDHKSLKIVPLSETVEAIDESDTEAGKTIAPARKQQQLKQMPKVDLLDPPETKSAQGYTPEQLETMSRLLEVKLKDFGVVAEVTEVNPGPVITRFEIQLAPGTKVSKVTNLAKDLARSMAVMSVRVVEVIAGKSVIGIEIPNENREMVRLREVLGANVYSSAGSKLSLGLGNDIAGNPVVVNLAKMPHLLVAGTTGSGKSVGVNAMLLSLLFKATPDEVRLMMVDPKMLELSIYDGIPHLLTPVITDMKEAATGLRWCVAEMERRYKLMAKMGVRNLAGFNDKIRAAEAAGTPLTDPLWNPVEEGFDESAPAPALQTLPYIVVVIDEFADMMMIVGKKVEELIARIAQKARAAGIHLILATQRPSVDVITGLIKANVPTRIAFQVSSKIDSRTILDQGGAEHLLGNGDMLYLPAGSSMPIRVHGAFVSDDEVHRTVEAWKKWGPADFVEEILMESVDMDTTGGSGTTGSLFEDEQDPLYDEAVAHVTKSRRASISAVQRKLKIGYNRAARMIEAMEAAGVVSEAAHNGSREVLAPPPVEMN